MKAAAAAALLVVALLGCDDAEPWPRIVSIVETDHGPIAVSYRFDLSTSDREEIAAEVVDGYRRAIVAGYRAEPPTFSVVRLDLNGGIAGEYLARSRTVYVYAGWEAIDDEMDHWFCHQQTPWRNCAEHFP